MSLDITYAGLRGTEINFFEKKVCFKDDFFHVFIDGSWQCDTEREYKPITVNGHLFLYLQRSNSFTISDAFSGIKVSNAIGLTNALRMAVRASKNKEFKNSILEEIKKNGLSPSFNYTIKGDQWLKQ